MTERRHPWLAGALAGSLESLINYPLDYIKVQLQLRSGTRSEILKHTLEQAGVRGFYRGYSLAFWFAFPSAAVRFSTYEFAKKNLEQVNWAITMCPFHMSLDR
jgi:hypothetical protein